jgi:hypothetical protein
MVPKISGNRALKNGSRKLVNPDESENPQLPMKFPCLEKLVLLQYYCIMQTDDFNSGGCLTKEWQFL